MKDEKTKEPEHALPVTPMNARQKQHEADLKLAAAQHAEKPEVKNRMVKTGMTKVRNVSNQAIAEFVDGEAYTIPPGAVDVVPSDRVKALGKQVEAVK